MNDPQTEADRRAQQCIVGNLIRKFPKLTVIGEEDLAQQTNVDIIEPSESDILTFQCPEDLSNLNEEDVSLFLAHSLYIN